MDEGDTGGRVDDAENPADVDGAGTDSETGAAPDDPTDTEDAEANVTGAETGADRTDDREPTEVGDARKKHVSVVRADGERVDHGDVYLRHSEEAFVVSPEPDFAADETERYPKAETSRVEVTQHHSACFITTAAVGEGVTLDALRGFRDDALRPTPAGRALVVVYEAVSPPIAATLAAHPESAVTRGVRWLVERCGELATRREKSASPAVRAGLSAVLTALYVVGVCWAALGHAYLRLRDGSAGT